MTYFVLLMSTLLLENSLVYAYFSLLVLCSKGSNKDNNQQSTYVIKNGNQGNE